MFEKVRLVKVQTLSGHKPSPSVLLSFHCDPQFNPLFRRRLSPFNFVQLGKKTSPRPRSFLSPKFGVDHNLKTIDQSSTIDFLEDQWSRHFISLIPTSLALREKFVWYYYS